MVQWVQDDPINQIHAQAFTEDGTSITAPTHRILRYSPVISGLMLYQFRATIYMLGLQLANSWGSILYPLHLYHALQQENLLSPRQAPVESWDDMYVVEAILGRDSFYVGSQLPQNRREYVKKLGLQIGISANFFTKSKSSRALNFHNLVSKGVSRGIKRDCAPVSDMFIDRYVLNTGQVDWTPEHVDRVIYRSLFDVVEWGQTGLLYLDPITDPDRLRERKRNIAAEEAGKRAATATGARTAPGKLITNLYLALAAESATLRFPYLTLHRAAWGFLRAAREACGPTLLQMYGPMHLEEDETLLPHIVTSIFMAMDLGDDRLLVKACEVLKDQYVASVSYLSLIYFLQRQTLCSAVHC